MVSGSPVSTEKVVVSAAPFPALPSQSSGAVARVSEPVAATAGSGSASATAAEAGRLRQDYWKGVRDHGIQPKGKVFVDKLPLSTIKLPVIAKLFPDAKVLFCGDLLWHMPPNTVDGNTSKWIATVRGFEQLPDAASMTFVPGHGDLETVRDVAIFRGYLTDLASLTAAGRKRGLKGEALVADVVPKLQASHTDYPTPTRVVSREVTFMEQELDGTKRVPQPAP